MSDMSITREHCGAVNIAAYNEQITDENPISDELMAPFMAVAEGFEGDHASAIEAVLQAIDETVRQSFATACSAVKDDADMAKQTAQRVKKAVKKGFSDRGWHA